MENQTMRVIVSGTRTIEDYDFVLNAIHLSGFNPLMIVSGKARGPDRLGELFAKVHQIPVQIFPADWTTGKTAGFVRNLQMAEYADALVAIWDGFSNGTRHMIQCMNYAKKQVYVALYGSGLEEADETLRRRFAAYHAANPHVYVLWKRFADEALDCGMTKISHWLIGNRVRWEGLKGDEDRCGDQFAISNGYFALYARLLVRDDPQKYGGLFSFRQMKGD